MAALPRLLAAGGATALCLALGACGGSKGAEPTTTAPTVAPTTATTAAPATTTTSVAPTTTTTGVPSAAQPSDDDAAQAFVNAWSQGQRAAALTVATRRAVDEAFRAGYPDGGIEERGCSDTFEPRICTYGALSIGALVEIDVREAPSGWYVTGVVVET